MNQHPVNTQINPVVIEPVKNQGPFKNPSSEPLSLNAERVFEKPNPTKNFAQPSSLIPVPYKPDIVNFEKPLNLLNNGGTNYIETSGGKNPSFKHDMNFNFDYKIFCNTHRQEEIKYFCFDCLDPPICAEDVIHGKHKTHNVQNIRNAINPVVTNLQESLQTLNLTLYQMQSVMAKMNIKIKQRKESQEMLKSKVKLIFDDAKDKLAIKEKEIYSIIDKSFEELNKDLDSTIIPRYNSIKNNVEIINKNYHTTNPINLLNFFSANNEAISNEIEFENSQKQNYNDIANNQNPEINVDFLAIIQHSILNANEIVNSLKPPEVWKTSNSAQIENSFNKILENYLVK